MDQSKNFWNGAEEECAHSSGGMEQMWTLYVFELKKIVCRKMVWGAAGIMVLLCVLMGFADLVNTEYSYSKDGKEESVTISGYEQMEIEKRFARALSGRKIDDTLLKEMQDFYKEKNEGKESGNEMAIKSDLETGAQSSIIVGGTGNEDLKEEALDIQRYMPILFYVQWIMQDFERTYTTDAESLYTARERLVAENRADQMLTEKEQDHWKAQDARLNVPFTYTYMDGWKNLWDQANVINCMLLLLLSISLSGVFSMEHLRRTDAMILCSQYGKSKLYIAKILAGITFGAATALLLFGAAAVSDVAVSGADGLDGALQVSFPLSSRRMSMGQLILLLIFLVLVISALYSIAIMFLSEWMKKSVGVMAVPVGIMIFTLFVDIPYRFKTVSQIYDLLPTNLLMRQELWNDRLFSVMGKYLTNFQMAPVVYILFFILLFGMGKRIYQKYQVGA